jgi:hypothetical protein
VLLAASSAGPSIAAWCALQLRPHAHNDLHACCVSSGCFDKPLTLLLHDSLLLRRDIATGGHLASYKGGGCSANGLALLGRDYLVAAQAAAPALHFWTWHKVQLSVSLLPCTCSKGSRRRPLAASVVAHSALSAVLTAELATPIDTVKHTTHSQTSRRALHICKHVRTV